MKHPYAAKRGVSSKIVFGCYRKLPVPRHGDSLLRDGDLC